MPPKPVKYVTDFYDKADADPLYWVETETPIGGLSEGTIIHLKAWMPDATTRFAKVVEIRHSIYNGRAEDDGYVCHAMSVMIIQIPDEDLHPMFQG